VQLLTPIALALPSLNNQTIALHISMLLPHFGGLLALVLAMAPSVYAAKSSSGGGGSY